MCSPSCSVLLCILWIARGGHDLLENDQHQVSLSRWHNNYRMGCIKREGFSYTGFHKGVFTLGRNYEGSDAFLRIMSLILSGFDSSTECFDKCTSMGLGFGLKAFAVPQTLKGLMWWNEGGFCHVAHHEHDRIGIGMSKLSTRLIDKCASMTMGSRLSPMYSFADTQIKNKDGLEVWLGISMFTWRACVCAISINNPSIRRCFPMLSNTHIPTNVLPPVLCSNIVTSTTWIMHLRQIRGRLAEVSRHREKCLFR